MSRGMSKDEAIRLNADLKYGNLSEEEKAKRIAKAEADIILNRLP